MKVQTRGTLDRELNELEDGLLRIESMVATAIARSIQALADNDARLAQQVVAEDAAINDLRFEIESACLSTVATQQPMAGDLREILAAMIVVTELERMGDHAAGTARLVLRSQDEPPLQLPNRLREMTSICKDLLPRVLDAFIQRDSATAYEIAAQDDEIDRLHRALFEDLVASALGSKTTSGAALTMLFASHNIERIGDRITNIAERVIFVVEGKLEELNVT